MKKILLYFVLITSSVYGQRGAMQFAHNSRIPQYNAWSKQLTTEPSAYWTDALDLFIRKCIIHGNWYKFDRLWIFATETQANARVSIVNPSPTSAWPTNITEVNSPSWAADRGYQGDASTSYLNTNYNSSSNRVNYSQNNASFGVYSLTNSYLQWMDMGVYHTNYAFLRSVWRNTNYYFTVSVNSTTITYPYNSATSLSSIGLFATDRTDNASQSGYKNGALLSTSTAASTGYDSYNFFICGANSGRLLQASGRQYAMAFIGASIDESSFYNDFHDFANTIGF